MQKNESLGRVNGFVDKDTEINGEIKFNDSFRIDGKFKGKILSGVSLIVGEDGIVEAEIDVESVSINGVVKGSVKAKNKIEIFAKGRVTGELVTPKLIIEEGAFFQGSSQMELKVLDNKSKFKAEGPQADEKK
ncbi:MAG: polymer-forming cytoskeletal protein [Acidobacteriota bacterium]